MRKRRRDKTIAAQISLIAEPEEDEPKNDGLGFARIVLGGEPGDEADVDLRNRAERDVRQPEWARYPEEVKQAFVELYGTSTPPREVRDRAAKDAVYLAIMGPR